MGATKRYIFAIVFFFLASGVAVASEGFDVTSKYVNRDFSSLLKPKSEFLGYIGNHYQRLRITFTSVMQDENDYTVLSGKRLFTSEGTQEWFRRGYRSK